ncbi:MAG: valine--tRNA ligase [Anaerolineaceae bacterium]|nr:valine--tRNA ligase [Anaerolineaceae bacterium]MDD4041887.1 valine--tRNA ligase [Anaerolineaceae bacterium]MDD4577725.1 valine--tRNA ligase [Anaerolineaceae bacterium]
MTELPKAYDFKEYEEKIYQVWEEKGYFKPTNDPNLPGHDPSLEPFVIVIPPPNVTGVLHLGHPLFVTTEDIMIRYHRMKGEPTLWVPGTDHAGIATQLQVENQLRKEGTTREEIGREVFEARVWEWKEKYGGEIIHQLRRLGASCDWDRERFTLDEGLSRAVREAFVQLYEKGLVYQGPRMINWSPGLQTAVSDLEVEYTEEQGTLYYFKYMLADGSGDYLPVATTRPETIPGDSGVAVHPEDDRYQRFVGKEVLVPILGRKIPVVADDYVTKEFGTGALKITPGHDPHDNEIGQRHHLELINIMNKDATLNENAGPYAGMDRFIARKAIWADMKTAGLVIKEEPYLMNVPRTQRGGEIVEPLVSTQWFVKMDSMAEAAAESVRSGEVTFVPERFTKVFLNWMDNIEDWCISRQLWWGHRIPVWYCQDCHEVIVAREEPSRCPKCGSSALNQDPDVLDTWFSSGLWPFSVFGWPEETPDFKYFYPTSVMETGYDIIFFWVARMIMGGLFFTGKVPFRTVYLHGMVRDDKGQKMSKTKNNVIDPRVLMDEFGTDALRFSLIVGSSPGNDQNVGVKKVEANRNFANKVWNIGRFVINAINNVDEPIKAAPKWTLADQWIWARTRQTINSVNNLFETYQFGEAGRQVYEFLWSDFADWYLEASKRQLAEGGDRAAHTAIILTDVLGLMLRLLHPFTPFVTEALYGYLKDAYEDNKIIFKPDQKWEEQLVIARWPERMSDEGWESGTIKDFELVQGIVRAIRNLRSEYKVDQNKPLEAVFISQNHKADFLRKQKNLLIDLAGLKEDGVLVIDNWLDKGKFTALVVEDIEIYLNLEGDSSVDRERMERELNEAESHVARLEKLLSSPFAQKAPANVVAAEREKLAGYKSSVEKLKERLK